MLQWGGSGRSSIRKLLHAGVYQLRTGHFYDDDEAGDSAFAPTPFKHFYSNVPFSCCSVNFWHSTEYLLSLKNQRVRHRSIQLRNNGMIREFQGIS